MSPSDSTATTASASGRGAGSDQVVPGITRRHSRRCESRRGRACSCRPTYQAQAWSARDRKPVRRTFSTLGAARAWRQEAQVDLRRRRMNAPSARLRARGRGGVAQAARGPASFGPAPVSPTSPRRFEATSRRLSERSSPTSATCASRRSPGRGSRSSSIEWSRADWLRRPSPTRSCRCARSTAAPSSARRWSSTRPSGSRCRRSAEARPGRRAARGRGAPCGAPAAPRGAVGNRRLHRASPRRAPGASVERRRSRRRHPSRRALLGSGRGAGPPKSRSGERTVPIPSALRGELRAHRLRQGSGGVGFVFSATGERPFDPSNALRAARRVWRAAGLSPLGFHQCRHTYASFMIAAGVNAKALSAYMGHSSITVTLDRYGHLMPGNERQAAALLDRFLERGRGPLRPRGRSLAGGGADR